MDDGERFSCGCRLEAAKPADRCADHKWQTCHLVDKRINESACPPCRRAKLLSVNLSRKATPTRGSAA